MHSRSQVLGRGLPLLGLLAGGCASNPLSLPPLSAALGGEAASLSIQADAPVDVYARVARGALKCWFGAEGSLKKTHVFHAKVDPPTAGGAAEIVVHSRDPHVQARDANTAAAGYAALRAYRVSITPAAGGSLVEAQNVRFPEAQGADMNRDVARWLAGKEDCAVIGTGGWGAGPAAPPQDAAQAKGGGPRAKAKPEAAKTKPEPKQP